MATQPEKKGKPTPKRKDQQALNARPLILDKKADSKVRRAAVRADRDREQEALRSGDERYMPAQHKGPVRKFARDMIDARASVGEYLLPIAFVALGASLFLGENVQASNIMLAAYYALIVVGIVEAIFAVRRIRKAATDKFGASKIPAGFTLYIVTRHFQLRRLRMPRPGVQRGDAPR